MALLSVEWLPATAGEGELTHWMEDSRPYELLEYLQIKTEGATCMTMCKSLRQCTNFLNRLPHKILSQKTMDGLIVCRLEGEAGGKSTDDRRSNLPHSFHAFKLTLVTSHCSFKLWSDTFKGDLHSHAITLWAMFNFFSLLIDH